MNPLPTRLFSAVANLFYSPEVLATIRERIEPAPGLKLLDVPCGTGTLFEICRPCEYYGVDIDERRVQTVQRTFGDDAIVRCSSAAVLPYPPETFDRILAAGLFHHVPEEVADQILLEFLRVLRPGGKLILFDAIWPRQWWNVVGWVARHIDEGKFVRDTSWYQTVFQRYFTEESLSHPHRLGLDYILARYAKV